MRQVPANIKSTLEYAGSWFSNGFWRWRAIEPDALFALRTTHFRLRRVYVGRAIGAISDAFTKERIFAKPSISQRERPAAAGAEGATAPETLRQKDRAITRLWKVARPRPPKG